MPKKNRKESQSFTDCFIREVRVNYLPTTTAPFAISGPERVVQFVRSILLDNSREQVVALYLDGGHKVVAHSIIAVGSANFSPVHPREIFQRAVLVGATAVILAHNHPSGDVTPSQEDRTLTKRIHQAGLILGIKLLDHVIVTDSSFCSLEQRSPELWTS